MDLPPRNCPVCNLPSSPAGLIGRLIANHAKLDGVEFSLTQCSGCELIYVSPAPTDSNIRAMYAESSQFDQAEAYRGERAIAALDYYSGRFRALLLKMNIPEERPIRILEVGAGLSWMSRAAKNSNPRHITVAQDITSEAVSECTWVDHYCIADIMDCPQIEEWARYDLVSLTHVFEHLVDPVAVLRQIRQLITPAGIVFITAPHRPVGWTRDADFETWKRWAYNHTPAHVQYFSRSSMERAVRDTGYELVHWDAGQEEGQVFEAWLQPPQRKSSSLIHPEVRKQSSRYRKEFANGLPFKHVVIDNFFEGDKAEQLLVDFPPFDPENAENEFGDVGGKATVSDIQRIGPSYAELYRYLESRDFLDFVSHVTGIPDLVHDEQMFGGGTHENLDGQELDPHIDFNFIENRQLHRRLNLLLYLNKEWEESWGGSLELHSNPRQPTEDQIKVITPGFNRCVIFETSERSWHGFAKIQLPEGRKHLSRKLVSVYLYTPDRPAEEIVPQHGTFYVQRPLPAHLVPGHTLTEEDVRQIDELCCSRDRWIEYYHKKELRDSQTIQDLSMRLPIPLTGCALQEGPSRGFWDDGWVSSPFQMKFRLQESMEAILVRGALPLEFKHELELCVSVNGGAVSRHNVRNGLISLEIRVQAAAGELVQLRIVSDKSYCPAQSGRSTDNRELVILLKEIRVIHAQSPPGNTGRVRRVWEFFRNL